jgi:hypothetical protein
VNLLPELGVGVDLMHGAPVSALHFETNEFHRCLSIFWQRLTSTRCPNQKPQGAGNRTAFIVDIPDRANSIDNDVINHAKIAHVCVINTHVRAGFDRGLDHFACLIHNVTRPVENISARNI